MFQNSAFPDFRRGHERYTYTSCQQARVPRPDYMNKTTGECTNSHTKRRKTQSSRTRSGPSLPIRNPATNLCEEPQGTETFLFPQLPGSWHRQRGTLWAQHLLTAPGSGSPLTSSGGISRKQHPKPEPTRSTKQGAAPQGGAQVQDLCTVLAGPSPPSCPHRSLPSPRTLSGALGAWVPEACSG